MMKISTVTSLFLGFFVVAGGFLSPAKAQTPTHLDIGTPEFSYHLKRFRVAGTQPPQYLWRLESPQNEAVRLDGTAFKSLASPTLRKWIIDWQQGSVPITYMREDAPGKKTDTKASKLLNEELDEFVAFCHTHNEPFIVSAVSHQNDKKQ